MTGLHIGDNIGIISTARKINYKELKPAINILEKWGFNIVLGNNLFEQDHQFAGNVEQRSADLQEMIDNKEIKAILCARGGYGTVQIIDCIDFSALKSNPKWIIGFSDITVLHSHLNNLGISTLHATMPINFTKNSNMSLESLRTTLLGKSNIVECKSHNFNRIGKIEGDIVGGNLSILYSLLGSESDLDTKGKILLIEDLDEYLYHVDRMLMNLKRNGKLTNLKGLIVGGMEAMNDNDISFGFSAYEIISKHVQEYCYPVCFNFPVGHIEDNRCIKLGVNSLLKITENGVSLFQ